jgi:membrane-associated phospholipid phosphatase
MHTLIIFCAKYLILAPVLVVIYLEGRSLVRRQYELVMFGIGVAILAFVLAKLGSHLISDPRPYVHDGTAALVSSAKDNGFPSDHTLLASVAAVIGWHYSRKVGLVLAVIAIAVGWGRVAAHVHHLEDVVGSMVCALLGYLLTVAAFRYYRSRRPGTPVTT